MIGIGVQSSRMGAGFLGLVCLLSPLCIAKPAVAAAAPDVARSAEKSASQRAAAGKLLHSMPLYFVPNAGQADPAVRFVAHGHGYELDLDQNALAITAFSGHQAGPAPAPVPAPVVMQFDGANPAPQIEGASPDAAKINYLIGNDPKQWHRNLPVYRQVRYQNLYPGIDLVCYGVEGGKLEYDLVVAPGADPGQIRFRFGAGHNPAIGADGDLHVDGTHGSVSLGQPVFYQNMARGKSAIFGSFVQNSSGEFGFRAVKYDHTRPLVIDPPINILYSTYFGGSLDDEAAGMAIDSSGNSYITGDTNSVDMLSTTNAYQPGRAAPTANYQVTNAFIAKFDPSGTLLYGTYLGGSDLEWGGAIAVDANGNAYVTGLSDSSDFPTTPNAYSAPSAYGNQMFISEISADGSTLEYSTIYGNTSYVGPIAYPDNLAVVIGNMGIAVSARNTIYVSASAHSGLPTSPTAYMGSLPGGYLGYAAFVAEFDPTQVGSNQLLASTYFTAPTPSAAQNYTNTTYYGTYSLALTLDNSGNVWIGGEDGTGALPTTANAYQKTVTLGNPSSICGTGSPLISAPWFAEFSSDLSQLKYATYLSGGTAEPNPATCNEWVQGLASGSDGSIYVAGNTSSATFPTTAGALQSTYPGPTLGSAYQQGFVSKFSPGAASLVWSTYLGQSGGATVIAGAPFIDAQNNVWVPGELTGTGGNFPLTSNDLGSCAGPTCAFVTGISSNGSGAVFSTAIGASLWPTIATGVALDSAGNIHVAGLTNDSVFPTSSNAIQSQLNAGLYALAGDGDWFFTILGSGAVTSPTGAYVGGNDGDDTITLTGSGYQQGATCSLVSGGTTIASSQATVSPDGTQITCTFPLAGAALGNYNIVVTEPGGATTTEQNNFTVEQGQGPNIWVNLTGRSHLRSNLPSTMTLTYGNSGDTDAYGVPIFVTIPTGVTVQVLSTLLAVPNPSLLDVSTLPQTVTVGNNTVLPLYVPLIAPGTSGSIQIQVTPPATDTDITLTAYNYEPLDTSLSDLGANLGTWQAGDYNQLKMHSGNLFSERPGIDAEFTLPLFGGTPMDKCLQDTIVFGLQIAGQVVFDAANPLARDYACGAQLAQFIGTAATSMANAAQGAADPAADLGGLAAAGGQTALACFEALEGGTPAGMAVNVALGIISLGIQAYSTLKDCNDAVQTQNPQNKNSSVGGAIDPNDKSGPTGDGSANQYIRQQPLTYNLAFENDPTATLPAATVVVTDQLDPTKVNLSTFSLGLISFGGNTISVPSGTTSFSTLYSLNSSLSVQIQASLNSSTGLATWTFTSIDPSTGLPPTDPTVGFLPPDTNGIVGQGSVLFNVSPISSLATGAQINNTANVVFDSNAAISTPTWLNTIDVTPPASSVTALPSTETASGGQATFNVNWSGTDVGSGVANYTVYVSVNGAAFTPWLVQTTSTSAAYTGTVGNSYAFYSIATDGAGNLEAAKTAAEATTQVVAGSSTTALMASVSSVNAGGSVTLTATVSGPSGSTVVPTGSVEFMLGSTDLSSVPLDGTGAAQLITTTLPVGADNITAVYSGDTNYNGSTSGVVTVTVALIPTTTTLMTSAANANLGTSITFTATVSSGAGTPGGNVTFMNGSNTLGTGTLNGSGVATYTTSSLAAGSYSITADYGGSSTYAASTSAAVAQTITAPSFTVGFNPSTVTVAQGASGSTTLTVTPTGGFSQAVSFSCSGLPMYATCAFSPASLTPSGAAVTTTLTIATNVSTAMLDDNTMPPARNPGERGALFAGLALGLVGLVRARRRAGKMFSVAGCCILFILLAASIASLSGCGGGQQNVTPTGSSTVTVTASGGGVSQTAIVTVTVQQ